MENRDQVPLGYRSVSKQFNSMVFSTTAGGRWVLFGVLRQAGHLAEPRVLYCPTEVNPRFMLDTADNPWPATGVTPSTNIQAGYGMRPEHQIPDNLSAAPAGFVMPRLNQFRDRAILADLTSSGVRVATRHASGINVLWGDGSAEYVASQKVLDIVSDIPEPPMPPSPLYNDAHTALWELLDTRP